MQYRAVDGAGNTSNWFPAVPIAGSTVQIDRTAPGAPTVTGGSLSWQNVPSISFTGSGSADSGGSGLTGYQYRTSANGGSSWSGTLNGATATVTGEGTTIVQFRASDGAGNFSAWAPASAGASNTAQIDRTPPTAPSATGGSLSWQSVPSVTVTPTGATDSGSGIASYEYRTSTDNGATWSSATAGSSAAISAQGVTLVQFRATDNMGFVGAWGPTTAGAGSTVKLDHTAPSLPNVAGGSLSWQSASSITVTGSGSTDTGGSGLGPYQYRTSTDSGTTWSAAANGSSVVVSAEGTTLVELRSTDTSGNASAWAPAVDGAGNTVMLDRTAPTLPTVVGGSLSWQSVPSVTVSASGSSDVGVGGVAYSYRTSTNGGVTWSSATAGSSVTVSNEGATLVQFRTADALGNTTAWAPATSGASNTVMIDRTNPTAPGAGGGSPSWQSVPSVTVTGSGANDPGGSGVAAYAYRTSTDGGTTWSAPTTGSSVTITSEGETLVQFSATDQAGNSSAWAPAVGNSAATVRLDRSQPSDPTVTGGSSSWQSALSVSVSGSGSADTGGSGLAGYQYRTSIDNGTTWSLPSPGSAVSITAEGQTLVQFRSVDGAGNTSNWAPTLPTAGNTVLLDRTGPTDPAVGGGSAAWQSVSQITLAAGGSTDSEVGVAGYEYRTSTDGGQTWSLPSPGSSVSITAEGQTLVQFRAVDALGNDSNWAPTGGTASATARIDVTGPTVPTVTGGSLAWQSVDSVAVSGGGSTDALSGIAGYQWRTSTDGGTTWSSATGGSTAPVTAEGETLVQFRAIDGAGNFSAWAPSSALAGSTVRIDRGAPTAPTVSGGSLAWQNVSSVTVSASGGTDGGAGLAGYQYRLSIDGGASWGAAVSGSAATISGQGETLVQFRSVDLAGNVSAWAPGTPDSTDTVRIDRTAPVQPTISGGSLAWQSVNSVTISATGSTDTWAGFDHYEMRTSTDGGATWTSPTTAAAITISAPGETLAQFRSVDAVGNASAWAPASPGPTNTVRLDRTAPSDPTVSGGSLTWQQVSAVTISAGGATDGLSGVSFYQYRTSTDGGVTWSPTSAGASVTVTTEGETIVQFQTVDAAGNTSNWAPASAGQANTVRIDRTAPSTPTVSGGSLTWQNVSTVTVTGSGSDDGAGSGVASYQHRSSTDGGTTWTTAQNGGSVTIGSQGQTLVQFRAVDATGLQSAWAPASAIAGSTVRIDRTDPGTPTVSGGALAWQDISHLVLSANGASDPLSGVASYQYRTSTNGGTTWSGPLAGSSVNITAEGETLVQFRAVDAAGNIGAWAPNGSTSQSTARIDRTPPAAAVASGGSLSWTNASSVTVHGSAGDAGSGVASYEYRTSTNNGQLWSAAHAGASIAVTAAGQTLVQFRATDVAGFTSAWAPAANTAGATVRIDRTAPTAPAVTGGSNGWQSVASVAISASGGSDNASGVASYQYRTSTNNGSTWSAVVSSGTATITAQGTTIVQFRSVDGAGNVSGWAPAGATAGSTAMIDRTPPTLPTVSGGSLTCAATRTIAGSGATDSGSGGVHYQYQLSTDGGTTYGTVVTRSSVTLATPGNYVVQFRAVDAAGNASAWAPASPGAAASACIV